MSQETCTRSIHSLCSCNEIILAQEESDFLRNHQIYEIDFKLYKSFWMRLSSQPKGHSQAKIFTKEEECTKKKKQYKILLISARKRKGHQTCLFLEGKILAKLSICWFFNTTSYYISYSLIEPFRNFFLKMCGLLLSK